MSSETIEPILVANSFQWPRYPVELVGDIAIIKVPFDDLDHKFSIAKNVLRVPRMPERFFVKLLQLRGNIGYVDSSCLPARRNTKPFIESPAACLR